MKITILFGSDNNICFQDENGITDPQEVLDNIVSGKIKIKKEYLEPVKLKVDENGIYQYYEEIVFYIE